MNRLKNHIRFELFLLSVDNILQSGFDGKDLQNLGIGEAIARIERAEFDFNLKTSRLPRVEKEVASQRLQTILQNTRGTFSKPKHEVEAKLMSGRPIAQEPAATTKAGKTIPPEKAESREQKTVNERDEKTITRMNNQPDGSHRYLQGIIKRIGESNGFVATLEKQVFGGIDKVDVALENEFLKIACDVAVTNTAQYELQNIQKCLASGFDKVVVVSADTKHLAAIKRQAAEIISSDQLQRVCFLEPEYFHLFLEKLNAESNAQMSQDEKVRGYRVNVSFAAPSESDQKTKEQIITDIMTTAHNS